ncbi:ecto-NOX disulfide-thiol exchanger 1-like isoform X3 [Stigmatopora nigra]
MALCSPPSFIICARRRNAYLLIYLFLSLLFPSWRGGRIFLRLFFLLSPSAKPLSDCNFSRPGRRSEGVPPAAAAAAAATTAAPPPLRDIIRHDGCALFPRNPRTPSPPTRPRPPGCKTVFVGGLPENAGEEVVRQVFGSCGHIVALRMSKKNFCHVRFGEEFMVDRALLLSGYRLQVGAGVDKKDRGKIHVDFARARDDQYEYEWECKRRLLEGQKGGGLPDAVPKEQHDSGPTAALLSRLDGGEVTRANANQIYALMQSAHAHARRLRLDAERERRTLRKARDAFDRALADILWQLDQISSALAASGRPESRERFSKAQRKNIDVWTRECQEAGDEASELRRRRDRDDDDPGPAGKKAKTGPAWPADAFYREAEPAGASPPLLQMQQRLRGLREQLAAEEAELERAHQTACLSENHWPQVNGFLWSDGSGGKTLAEGGGGGEGGGGIGLVSQEEALLLGVMAAFLHVHPFGANLEYLGAYVRTLRSQVSSGQLERLMSRLPLVFRQELSGVGATLEKRWKFCAFDSLRSR